MRKALAIDSSDAQLIREYALALAAADRKGAAAEFHRWMVSLKDGDSDRLKVPAAGLALLAGDTTEASNAAALARARIGEEWAPQWLGELGAWYYMAGDYATALELLNDALQQRPGDPQLSTVRAWVQIQNRTLADALQGLDSVYGSRPVTPDTTMARAIAQWLAHERVAAMANYSTGSGNQPEWKDPRWVKALYSPVVVEAVGEMEAEQRRQETASKK